MLFMIDQDPYMTTSRIYCAEAMICQGSIADLSLVAVAYPINVLNNGSSPKGLEGQADIAWRHDLLRKIGYKR